MKNKPWLMFAIGIVVGVILLIASRTVYIAYEIIKEGNTKQTQSQSASDTRSGGSADTTAASDKFATAWQTTQNTDAVTGEIQTMVFHVSSDGSAVLTIGKSNKSSDPLHIYILYRSGTLDSYQVQYGQRVLDATRVAYRFDGTSQVKQSWLLSEDHTTAYLAAGQKQFLDKLRHSQTLALDYIPYSSGPQSTVFDVDGFPKDF